MTNADLPSEVRSRAAADRGVVGHPAWCDLTPCTADPASQAEGYRPGVGGKHRSVPVPLDLSTAVGLSVTAVRDLTAWLTQACAPWPCDTYLRVQVGQMRLSLPTVDARQVLDALAALLGLATAAEQVGRDEASSFRHAVVDADRGVRRWDGSPSRSPSAWTAWQSSLAGVSTLA